MPYMHFEGTKILWNLGERKNCFINTAGFGGGEHLVSHKKNSRNFLEGTREPAIFERKVQDGKSQVGSEKRIQVAPSNTLICKFKYNLEELTSEYWE
jgi:hypothetical protein